MALPKAKFTLTPKPTFACVVDIPLHGGATAPVEFQFKHRTKAEFKEFFEGLKLPETVDGEPKQDGPQDSAVLLDVASGWNLDEPFNAESLEKMAQNYMGSPQAIVSAYFAELTGARVKN